MADTTVTIEAQSDGAALSWLSNGRGQSIDAVFSTRAAGFTPLELQAAALATCMDASLRIAARQAGQGPLGALNVVVEAIKAEDAPSRLDRFNVAVRFSDDLDPALKARLIAAAKDICTISNTLRSGDSVITAHLDTATPAS